LYFPARSHHKKSTGTRYIPPYITQVRKALIPMGGELAR
jgi:hypothetical protein